MRREESKGQALIIFVTVVGVFVIGIVGLAVDASIMYCHRQAAQSAADAAAQAGAMSVLGGTNVDGNAFTAGPCTGAANLASTPCHYANLNGFDAGEVALDFPAIEGTAPGFTPAAVRVTITRAVPSTFMRVLGVTSGSVRTTATAAILNTSSPIPIIILHPDYPGAFSFGGSGPQGGVTITGGASRSIQVNSKDPNAIQNHGGIDIALCTAGPNATGGDLGVFGGPAWTGGGALPGYLACETGTGTTVEYLQPAPPIADPLAGVPEPPNPGTAATVIVHQTADTFHGCSGATKSHPCVLYGPGSYSGAINIQNEKAIFAPGIYYITGDGFKVASNGSAMMCPDCGPTPAVLGGGDQARMLVYNAGGGPVNISANGVVDLWGATVGSTYKGILFFENRNAPPNTGSKAHSLGGGGSLTLHGTIYLTNSSMTDSTYQELKLSGNTGSNTEIDGEIIVSVLTIKGGGNVTMNLGAGADFMVSQVALVR
jgi:hypothetical protein